MPDISAQNVRPKHSRMPKKYVSESRLFQALWGISWEGATYSYPLFSFYVHWVHVTQLCNFTFIQLWQIPGGGDFVSFSTDLKILLVDSYSFAWLSRKHQDHEVEESFLCPGWKLLLLHDREGLNGHLYNVLCQYLVLKCEKKTLKCFDDPDGSQPSMFYDSEQRSPFCVSLQ